MACDLLTTELAACASGIGKIESQTRLLQLIAQLSCEIAAAGGGGTPGGAPSSVQYNNAGAFGGFGTFDVGTNLLTLPGDLLITGNVDTASRTLFDNTGSGSVGWQSRLLLDSVGNNSLDWSTRLLVDSLAATVLDWENKLLISGAVTSLDWVNRTLVDSTAIDSISWEIRMAFDTIGNNSIDWNDRQLFNTTGALALDWENRFMADSAANNSLDWESRVLIDATTAPQIDWSAGVNIVQGIITYGTSFTVAGLPAAGTAGRRAYVTDATGVFPLTGGGTTVQTVFDNGTGWIADGAQVFADNYGGAAPAFTPTTDAAIAFDTSDGVQYNWWGAAWH